LIKVLREFKENELGGVVMDMGSLNEKMEAMQFEID
jgi:hypothetical protein